MMQSKIKLLAVVIGLLPLFVSCSKEEMTDTEPVEPVEPITTPFQELYDQGIDRYLGVFTPSSSEEVAPGLMEHTFSGMNAPICYTGNTFSMFTRDGSNTNLLIFLQGGGFCSPFSCEAVETGIPLFPVGI